MRQRNGFWSDMPPVVRPRLFVGLTYFGLSFAVLSQAPIFGIVLLMLPILWTVLVIWIGSEDGIGFGPYSRPRDTAFGYVVRYLWHVSGLGQVIFATILAVATVGGLGWLSTAKMRAAVAEPTLTERVTTAAENATEATKQTTSGWLATAKGWFGGDDAAE